MSETAMTSSSYDQGRITQRFAALRQSNHSGLITFITAGDPNFETSLDILNQLPAAGADLIEIGMPFSDPMADGPAIQASSLRALKAGMTLARTLELVKKFRTTDNSTPIILMGYYNPIYIYGREKFLSDAVSAGVDGLIIVDLPPEEDDELCELALPAGLNWIRLTTPTTDNRRLPKVLTNASGFLYYVSITGITGTRSADANAVRLAVERLRRHSKLPIAVGFGIRTPQQAEEIGSVCDAAVVGSALVNTIAQGLDRNSVPTQTMVDEVLQLVNELAQGVRRSKKGN